MLLFFPFLAWFMWWITRYNYPEGPKIWKCFFFYFPAFLCLTMTNGQKEKEIEWERERSRAHPQVSPIRQHFTREVCCLFIHLTYNYRCTPSFPQLPCSVCTFNYKWHSHKTSSPPPVFLPWVLVYTLLYFIADFTAIKRGGHKTESGADPWKSEDSILMPI